MALAVPMVCMDLPFTCKDKDSSSLKIMCSVNGLALGFSSYWVMA